MAREFSASDIGRLISRHTELLKVLERVNGMCTATRKRIAETARGILERGLLKGLILADCRTPGSDITVNMDISTLLLLTLKYYKSQRVYEQAQNYSLSYAERIKSDISTLNRVRSGISWFFSGQKAKDDAVQAYQYLTDLLSGDYGQDVPDMLTELRATETIQHIEARELYNTDPGFFERTLRGIAPEAFSLDTGNPFADAIKKTDELRKIISDCESDDDKSRQTIIDAAQKMAAHKALDILREVPVDELNRVGSGYRIKLLHDAGVTTMADIYTATAQQLASINGISEDAAYSMKRTAQQFLTDAQSGVKVSLSADDRSTPATEVIKAVYIYRRKQISRKAFDTLTGENQWKIDGACRELESIGNGFEWLFCDRQQRESIKTPYAVITDNSVGSYAESVRRLSKEILNDKQTVSPDTAWNDFSQNSIEYVSILEELVPGLLGNDDSVYGIPEELAREIQEEEIFPDGLLCTLRRYQEWGVKYILHQKKVLLGDEMGLGKTIQAIAAMVSLRNTGAAHFLVICPASVITNWCREVMKHSKLRATKIHGAGRDAALQSWIKTGGVAVTTYETTASLDESVNCADFVVVDEAHYVKNPEARRTVNVKRICAGCDRILLMTGTALENRVDEMVSLIRILRDDIAQQVQTMTFMPSAPQFRNCVAPVYYRRKREDVLTELPELIESKEWCTLNPEEKEIYENNVLSKNFNAARRMSWDVEDLSKSCKATRLAEIVKEAEEEGRKVLVFSFFLDTIRAVGTLLGTRCYGPINGSVPPAKRQQTVDEFDKAPAGSVLIAQIQSGGTGLNIQSASVVVICEPQLKPSIENQAISRAYRMGQSRNVLVYRLLCDDTLDERITELLESKQNIFNAFADKSVAAENTEAMSEEGEVDSETLGQLIMEEIDRINAERQQDTATAADAE